MTDPISRRRFIKASGVALGASAIPITGEKAEAATAKALASNPPDATRILANWVVSSRWEDVPQTARYEAVRSMFNWVGCCLGGARHVTTDRALEALAEFSGKPEATVLGRPERLDIMYAALMNGITSHVLDYDDTHLDTIIHPAGPVASAILALGERLWHKRYGLHARLYSRRRGGMPDRPRRLPLTLRTEDSISLERRGVFGGAAAAGKLLGLNEQQMVWALGIAATQSAGLKEMFGTMCKPFHPGSAGQNGLKAALLASKNFTSSNGALEAQEGFMFTYSDEQDFSMVTDELGDRWEVEKNTYKPFACGIVTHPIIDGCIQLRNDHQLTYNMIDKVSLRVNPFVIKLTGQENTADRSRSEIQYLLHQCGSRHRGRGRAQSVH